LDRCALFVDAGYALGEGAFAVHGTRNRDSVSWDYAGLLKLLSSLSRDRTGLPLLRCYWYDMTGAGTRVAEHDALGDLPGVKVRLSKARPGRKEGVEAEIRKDLTALARNRSVSDVIVVSAEEDLAPVIAEVQEFGVRALLLNIGTDGSWAASRALRQECDELIEISPSHLRPYVDLISGAEPQFAAVGYRELPAASAQVSGPHPVLETAAARLFESPGPAGYERAAQLANVGGQVQDPRTQLPGADMRPIHEAQAAFGGADSAHSANGRSDAGRAHDFPQRGITADGRALGGPPLAAGLGQSVMGLAPSPGSAGPGAHALPGNGVPPGGSQANGVPASAGHLNGVPVNGMPRHGMSGTGLSAHGLPGGGLPPADPSAAVMPPGTVSQGGSIGAQFGAPPGGPQHQLAGQPILSAGPGQAGHPPQALQPPQQATPALPQAAPHAPGAGQHARAAGNPLNGLVAYDAQRPPLPQRQLPAGNGGPYGDDRGAPYPGQQLQQPYTAGPYGVPPSAPAPTQLPVGEAVQSAHAEGFGFGEAVARDAPALWLEAVLARKPRMPSDLEARLLQGSALPIDSLLHDEVRHALRRGFWDALERSRH
jgi:hypothetical protein